MNELVQAITESARDLDAEGLLRAALRRFGGRVALASSLSAEDQVLADMLCRLTPSPRIFTLDTGRLPQETLDVIEAMHERYGLRLKVLFPDREQVEAMVNEHGPNLFYHSPELRKQCCHVRKVIPLKGELATLDAWITGLRAEQAVTRAAVQRVEWDQGNGLTKLNPLADWTAQQVRDYIHRNNVPYNKLHDQGYPSIGCAPCTRAVKEGEDARAGRWWWERPEQKECGLHVQDGKLARKAGQA